jgi:hypothetical protein
LPDPNDDSNRPDTLPQAELNPLLNPTLGRNMGRWAEVYFTSPPEKREEAVQQLIRDLESENPTPVENQNPIPVDVAIPPLSRLKERPTGSISTVEPAQGATCFWCGYVNRPKYKFCGRCGEPLAASFTDPRGERPSDPVPAQTNRPARMFPSLQSGSSSTSPAAGDEFPPTRINRFVHSEAERTDLHLLSEPDERSFRPWFAAVLAAVVLALAYVAWRGTPTTQSPHNVAQAPSATTDSNATPAANHANTKFDTAQPGFSPGFGTITSSPPKSEASPKTDVAPATPPSSPVASDQNSAQTVTNLGKGGEELAQARNLLSGANGKARNTAQAAQWLWKAVRKGNADATMQLSELYLRGDGVPKSCEQARLLLDAAAIKGKKDAAKELQNLSAFGCE